MVTKKKIEEKIKILLQEILIHPSDGIEKIKIEDIILDSLDYLKLLVQIEKDFGIEIEDKYWDNVEFNVSHIVNYLYNLEFTK
ncbi:acyl carrier protein [Paenibacillus sp. OSY-SE]|uniref:acyl carrier protein n=1 Tax=Paenibacillus sp. OSY-SE TaxID=1196323 RepID=UPI0002DBDFBF|nr:acyl carrier protein [Paenibacillus sp. OSY-SE]